MDGRWEKKLGVSTCAAAFEKDDKNHSRYEPTSYAVLQRLAQDTFAYAGEVDCGDLFHNADEKERIVVFEIE